MESELKTLHIGICSIQLQLLVTSEFTRDNCATWSSDLLQKSEVTSLVNNVLSKWLVDTSKSGLLPFLTLRSQSLSSCVITFTSSVEFYLKDLILDCMRRNSNLRKKGFNYRTKDGSIDASSLFEPKNLEDHGSIQKAKIQVMKQLASIFTKGSVFEDKFNKATGFLDHKPDAVDTHLMSALNTVWALRNNVAHTDLEKVDWRFNAISGNEVSYNKYKPEQFFPFLIEIIKLLDATYTMFETFDQKAEAKWPLKDEISWAYFPYE